MTTFIMLGKYSSESVKHISIGRSTKGIETIQHCGGKFVSAYAMLGDFDILLIAEFPSVNDAIQASVALNRVMGITFSSVPAIHYEEFDELVGVN